MDNATLQKYLLRLFARHEVELAVGEDDWLVTDDDFPALRATWHEGDGGAAGRLDIDVVLSEERQIEESFAGVGGGETGCRDALRAFEHNMLHVLLAACWYVTDDRYLRIEEWTIGMRAWDVFIGPFTVRGDTDDALLIPASAMTVFEDAFKREMLAPQMHWARLVHGFRTDGRTRTEALLDNEPWPAATAALGAVQWPSHDRDYTARCCVIVDVRDY
ncbi:MAG: DUF6348 family protein [Rhodanobacter sp.]